MFFWPIKKPLLKFTYTSPLRLVFTLFVVPTFVSGMRTIHLDTDSELVHQQLLENTLSH